MNNTTQIGWYTLPQEADFNDSFESAAQYKRIAVPAGRYPVVVGVYNPAWGHYLAIELTGTCKASGYGPKAYRDEIDKPATMSLRPYKYQLGDAHYWGGMIELFDNAEVELAKVKRS